MWIIFHIIIPIVFGAILGSLGYSVETVDFWLVLLPILLINEGVYQLMRKV